MRVKRFFSAMLVYVLVFSLSIPVSAAELAGAASIETENGISVSGSDVAEVTVSEGDAVENEVESLSLYTAGNSFSDATEINMGTRYSGSISEQDPNEYYTFTINQSGRVTINVTAEIEHVCYYLYSSDGTLIWSTTADWDNVTKVSVNKYEIDLTQGKYYFVFDQYLYYLSGDYAFTMSYVSAGESFAETSTDNNNKLAVADFISLGTMYKGQIAHTEDVDFYCFELNESGKLTFDLTAELEDMGYLLYDEDWVEIKSEYLSCNPTTQVITLNRNIDLLSGTYYIAMKKELGRTGNYFFSLKHSVAGENFKETKNKTNNSMATANHISTGVSYVGQIALNDEKDFYKFSVSSEGQIKINAEASMESIYYKILDEAGNEKWSIGAWCDDTSKKSNISELISLNAGTYYFVAERDWDNTGNYSFNISEHSHKYVITVTKATTSSNGKVVVACECGKLKSEKTLYAASNIKLSKTTYTYDGKAKKPSVVVKDSQGKKISSSNYTVTYAKGRKDVGKYKVTIKFKGNYKGTVTQTFTITPKKTSITKLTGAKKGFTVKWNKVSKQATGYEVQYSPSSGFNYSNKTKKVTSAGKTSLKITGCKSKYTYYVRIRTYKTVSGKKYYSDWSKAKKIKTK